MAPKPKAHLRQRGDGPNLHKPKAQRQQRLNHFRILVKAGRHTCMAAATNGALLAQRSKQAHHACVAWWV